MTVLDVDMLDAVQQQQVDQAEEIEAQNVLLRGDNASLRERNAWLESEVGRVERVNHNLMAGMRQLRETRRCQDRRWKQPSRTPTGVAAAHRRARGRDPRGHRRAAAPRPGPVDREPARRHAAAHVAASAVGRADRSRHRGGARRRRCLMAAIDRIPDIDILLRAGRIIAAAGGGRREQLASDINEEAVRLIVKESDAHAD